MIIPISRAAFAGFRCKPARGRISHPARDCPRERSSVNAGRRSGPSRPRGCAAPALGLVFGFRGTSQVMRLARIFRQVIKLVLPAGLEMTHQLPLRCSNHPHPGDLVMMHVVLAKSVSSHKPLLVCAKWNEAPPPDLEVARCTPDRKLPELSEANRDRDTFGLSSCRPSRPAAHDERHPDRIVKHVGAKSVLALGQPGGVAFVPEPVVADHITVIAGENNDRLLRGCHSSSLASNRPTLRSTEVTLA